MNKIEKYSKKIFEDKNKRKEGQCMTVIYLVRHSNKYKNNGKIDCNDTFQIKNEKIILSVEGEKNAELLSRHYELQNIDEVWSSNYVRAIQTAKYICERNNIDLNISPLFDERHYGQFENNIDREEFWINQFIDKNLKNVTGESQNDVQKRFDKKIKEIIKENKDKRVVIVCHNACILFYLLKYCNLEDAKVPKKLTITYKGKALIKQNIMKSPSIMKLEFENESLKNITYIEI